MDFGDFLTEKVPLSHALVADAAGLQDNFALVGNCCPFCECPPEEFFYCKEKKEYPKRTLERLDLLAHLVPGICPGCNVEIVTKEQFDAEMARANNTFQKPKAMFLVAEQGDELPSSYLNYLQKQGLVGTWLQIHKQVRYASKTAVRVEPNQCYCCLLHGDVRIVGMLADASLWKSLSQFHKKKAFATETTCETIFRKLRKHGIMHGGQS